jgi:DNA ligase-1
MASREAIDVEFEEARGRGFEGLVLKRLDAPYAAGVRGFAWLKVKKAFATLDVVVVAAERGSGKRADVLSDYTFAVWNDGKLETIGKAYSGLTDAEIAAMTTRLRAIAAGEERRGRLPVRPEIVLEVAFDGIQRGGRHTSGFTLRFPRIQRIRDDKRPEEADTIAAVAALWQAQLASGHREESNLPKRPRGRRSGRRPDVRAASKQLKLFDDE